MQRKTPIGKTSKDSLEKHYDTDWAKAKVHGLLGDMLDRSLLTFKKPSYIRVLHFAGIDAQETRSVYLTRDIPPANIVCLERETKIANAIDELGLGIKVINQDLTEFVRLESDKSEFGYNVVSLDFTSPISWKLLGTIADICERNVENHFIIHTANLVKRDRNNAFVYSMVSGLPKFREMPADEQKRRINTKGAVLDEASLISSFEEFKRMRETENMADTKREYYPQMVLNAASNGSTPEYEYRMLKFIYGDSFEPVERHMVNEFRKFAGEEIEGTDTLIGVLKHSMSKHPIYENYVERAIGLGIIDFKKRNNLEEASVATLQTCLAFAVRERPILITKDALSYSYISESGSPMIGTMYYLTRPRYLRDAAIETLTHCGFPSKSFDIKDRDSFIKYYNRFVRMEEDEVAHLKKVLYNGAAEPIFIGNASKPVLTRKRFDEALDMDFSVEEIRQKYRGYGNTTIQQMRAWKAWHTMRTGKPAESDQELEIHNSGIEKVGKEEALDFLQAGVPPEEIYEAYPTSFTVGQLRAFKAHMTMGTYQRKD